MVQNNILETSKPAYSRFCQVKEAILGVEAIDYFFAKEILNALTSVNNSQHATEQITDSVSYTDKGANLYHVFLALSASLRAGHSCLPLNEIAGQHWGKGFAKSASQKEEDSVESDNNLSHAGFVFSSLAELQAMLTELNIKESDQQLLVFQRGNLYLRRYFQFESDLGQAINSRLLQQCQYDNNKIEQCIAALFPDKEVPNSDPLTTESKSDSIEIDWQKVAVANAINKNFSVIAGGPGTGKTYTVTKLLAALVMLAQQSGQIKEQGVPVLNIALVAPTGKAAQRLSESIVNAIAGFKDLIDDNVLAQIPTQAQTLHRLLGVLPNSPNFKHHEDNRLAYDIVLIDEVSMVDLPLMTRVFRALKGTAKVILLGDADQLPSVAAGSVLADIAPRPHGGYSVGNDHYLTQVCQLRGGQLGHYFSDQNQRAINHQANESGVDYLSFLVKSRRFDGKGGIGLIANSVIQGDVKSSWQLLNNVAKTSQLSLAQGDLSTWLAPLVKQYYQPIESCHEVSDAFELLSQFRVLCATRQGDYGVEQINEVIKGYLGKNNAPFQQHQQRLYHGQPIMIYENDYRLGLYNGDIGIIWRVVDQAGKEHLMACFEDGLAQNDKVQNKEVANTGNSRQVIRQILPSRLPKFESVYAMTIHKTQGSEFSHVAMVISATPSESQAAQQDKQISGSKLLSRELLYTGITRAKKQLTIAANQRVWQQGVTAQVQRHSGLRLCETVAK
jgi:exodeoxyribonuclease V alpha subunit